MAPFTACRSALTSLALLALLIQSLAAPQTCKPAEVPFAKDLIGKTFARNDDCFRPSAYSEVKIFRKLFVYFPMQSTSGPGFMCPTKYIVHFRRNGNPFIVYFPKTFDNKSQTWQENEKYCWTLQGKKYFPVGPTKSKFVKAVKSMVGGIKQIREYGCTTDKNGFPMNGAGPFYENVRVDGIVTYLIGLGYTFSFCV